MFPHDKASLKKGDDAPTKKSPVAWADICNSRRNGGLHFVSLCHWNQTNLLKLLWNLCGKADNLWVKWVHAYYIEESNIMTAAVPNTCSWILKRILNCRPLVRNCEVWNKLLGGDVFKTRLMYATLRGERVDVPWKGLMYGGFARPRARFTLWLACQDRLATKERLCHFGILPVRRLKTSTTYSSRVWNIQASEEDFGMVEDNSHTWNLAGGARLDH